MNAADDDDGFLWPIAGLSIEAGHTSGWFLALLQWQHAPEMKERSYISRYRLAAHLIFEHVAETGSDQDSLFYPLALTWRQHMELQLTSTLLELQRLQRLPLEYVQSHGLSYLWFRVRTEIEAAQPSDTDDLPHVQEILMQLHKMDQTGQEFRYPVKVNQTPSLPKLAQVDLEAFHTAMVRLSNFFNAEGDAIYEDRRMREEYEDYMANEYIYGN